MRFSDIVDLISPYFRIRIEWENRYQHVIRRAKERYDLELTEDDIKWLEARKNEFRRLYRNVYLIDKGFGKMLVAFRGNKIVTVLKEKKNG